MKVFIITLITIFTFTMELQAQNFRGIDRSPVDIAYYPDNFAHDREEGQEAIIRIIYGRPQKNDRQIFGGLVAYDKVWRTGANEATEIKLYQDVSFGGKKLAAGTYSLFTIPGKDEWTIIFNKDLDYWGAYSYNEDQDALRVTAKTSKAEDTIEAFAIRLTEDGSKKGMLHMGWDDTVVSLPFSY